MVPACKLKRPVAPAILPRCMLFTVLVALPLSIATAAGRVGRRFASSDSDARYPHVIELYDADNRKITSESTKPYSSLNTCGRCHDVASIAHGWHFNAFQPPASPAAIAGKDSAPEGDPGVSATQLPAADGRVGEPWIWTDPRTATQLPLSYRDWPGRFNPAEAGLSRYAMTKHFGDRVPGGGFASPEQKAIATAGSDGQESEEAEADDAPGEPQAEASLAQLSQRWKFSGALEIDCMLCHAEAGQYDFEARRDAIGDENFAWAATAGMRLGSIEGTVSRIREGSDPEDEFVQQKIPTVSYDATWFNADGRVNLPVVLETPNDSCYQCHSNRQSDPSGIRPRWQHDEDVHLVSGMDCIDCHRNGIEHHMVRGFPGEAHPGGATMQSLSCAGCHLGEGHDRFVTRGRLGSPLPAHAGIPPVHFERLTCTACHSGPLPEDEALGWLTSLAHSLGKKADRSGQEMPWIRGPGYMPLPTSDGEPQPITAARMMWPSFWGSIDDAGQVTPLPPDEVHSATRRALRVRRDFVEEILNDDEAGELFPEKVAAALEALEKEFKLERAVFVASGQALARKESGAGVEPVEVTNRDAVEAVVWPLAHNVRPAGQSLGVTGCQECHQDDGLLFASTITVRGPTIEPGESVTMASLQGIAEADRQVWNQMFMGRTVYKALMATSLVALLAILLAAAIAGIARRAVAGPSNPLATKEEAV